MINSVYMQCVLNIVFSGSFPGFHTFWNPGISDSVLNFLA